MTYQQLQEQAFTANERRSKQFDKIMLMSYNRAQTEIFLEMERIYAKVLSGVKPENYYVTMLNYDRLNKLLKKTSKLFNQYANRAGVTVNEMATQSMAEAFYRQQYAIAWVAPVTFSTIDPKLVELSVTGTAEAWTEIARKKKAMGVAMNVQTIKRYQPQYGTITDLLKRNKIDDLAKIQQAITQGFIQGLGINKVERNIRKVFDTSKSKAERIARTEFNRVANAGNYAAAQYADSQGVKIERMWLATLDLRTRSSHAALDGQKVGVDEPFQTEVGEVMYPGQSGFPEFDINCRCTVVDLPDGVEPSLRRGRKIEIADGKMKEVKGQSEVFNFKKYDQWLRENGVNPKNYKITE